jgi:hypothetical protein
MPSDLTNRPSRGKASHPCPLAAGQARRRRGGTREGQQAGLVRDWAYPCSIEVLGLAGEVAGERRRWSNGVAAVGARTPVRIGVVLIYV